MATVPSAFDNYQKLLQEQFKQSQTLADERTAVRQQQRDMINQPTSYSLLNPGQSGLLDMFKQGPDSAQSKFLIDFGVTLASSDPNKALSQRIGQAIGTGSKGMTMERDKERARNLSLSKLDMEDIQAKTELLKERQANRKSLFDLDQAQKQDARAERGQDIRERQLDIAEDSAKRQADEFARKQGQDFLTAPEAAKNANIVSARSVLDPLLEAGIDMKDLRNFTIARQTKDISELPAEQQGFANQLAGVLGKSITELNPAYNKFLTQALEDAGNPLLSGTGKKDTEVNKYKGFAVGTKNISDAALVKKLPNYNQLKAEFGRLYPKRSQTDENIAEYARQVAERNARNRRQNP